MPSFKPSYPIYKQFLIYICYVIALGLVMNIRIFVGDFEFNANLADIPMAILGLCAIIAWRLQLFNQNMWRVPALRYGLVLMGIILGLAFLAWLSALWFCEMGFFCAILGFAYMFWIFSKRHDGAADFLAIKA